MRRLLGLVVASLILSCATVEHGTADATYAGQVGSCLDKAASAAEARACKAKVDANWGVVDGGVSHD